MRDVCIKTEGLNEGIFSIQTEDLSEDESHYIYNNKDLSYKVIKKLEKFLI